MKVRHGITRTVFLVGNYAVKVPRLSIPWPWQHRVRGLLANITEHNLYQAHQYYKNALCPVLWCSWGGFVLVMRRARPYPAGMVPKADQCSLTTDHKPENYGVLNGSVVCIDYA
jgi:hypothetical protein